MIILFDQSSGLWIFVQREYYLLCHIGGPGAPPPAAGEFPNFGKIFFNKIEKLNSLLLFKIIIQAQRYFILRFEEKLLGNLEKFLNKIQ